MLGAVLREVRLLPVAHQVAETPAVVLRAATPPERALPVAVRPVAVLQMEEGVTVRKAETVSHPPAFFAR